MTEVVQDPFVTISKRGNKIVHNGKGFIIHTYPKVTYISITYRHKAINDYNQHLCGGWYIHDPVPFEEVDRVLQGLKPVGISRSWDQKAIENKVREARELGFFTSIISDDRIIWTPQGKKSTTLYHLTVSPKGPLKDFFDLSAVAKDYKRNGLSHEAHQIKHYQKTGITFGAFHNGKYDVEDHPFPIVGLILGYPLENTMSLIKYQR